VITKVTTPRTFAFCFLIGIWVCALALLPAPAQVNVLTQHNDNGRTGQNLKENVLNTVNVNTATFGKLFSRAVDGNIFAQPLYVSKLNIAGGVYNVIFVATAHNTVFAFDADDPNNSGALWSVSLGPSVPAQDICSIAPPSECPYTDVVPEIGIIATPVIDLNSGAMYVTANTKDAAGSYHWRLHALDLASGAEKFGGPAEVDAPNFDPFEHLNRPGLLLANGNIYLAFGSVGDYGTWHGWVMAYNASTLQQVAWFETSPNGYGSGIWHTGNGLISDASGNIYAVTSNGTFDLNTGGADYGSSYIKFSGNDLSVLDYFAPSNQSFLNGNNKDLGSGGPMLIPGTSFLVGGGKDAILRVVDTNNLGGFSPAQDNNVQEFTATNTPIFGSPVYWNSPSFGPVVYLWGQGDALKAWSFDAQSSTFNSTPVSQSGVLNGSGWANTAALSLSANQSNAGTGIIWGNMPYSGIANPGPVPGILHAVDANNLSNELWNSKQNPNDDFGNYAKFNPPTVANGKVYLGTFSNRLVVYGLNTKPDFSFNSSSGSATVPAGQTANYTLSVSPLVGFEGNVTFSCSGLPAGAACSFSPATVSLNMTGNAGTTLSITTTARKTGGLVPFQRKSLLPLYAVWLPMPGLVLAGLGASNRRRKLGRWTLAIVALMLLVLLLGCGGGGASTGGGNNGTGNGGNNSGGNSAGTPAGSYPVMVTANSGSAHHTATLTLTVQ